MNVNMRKSINMDVPKYYKLLRRVCARVCMRKWRRNYRIKNYFQHPKSLTSITQLSKGIKRKKIYTKSSFSSTFRPLHYKVSKRYSSVLQHKIVLLDTNL